MKTLKIISVLSLALLASFSSIAAKAFAEESGTTIVITDNGSGSGNSVEMSQSQNVDVNQNNNADVNNDINVVANTGNNSASDNTNGDTSIKTGDVEIKTNVTNNVNNSIASTACCQTNGKGGGQAVIVGNGSGSHNAVSVANTANASVNVNNSYSVTNNINGYANTGGNTASDNNGDVAIVTGNIKVKENIKNIGNTSYVRLGLPMENDFMAKIYGNGSWSDNKLDLFFDNDIDVNVTNNADITNNNNWVLNTGDNKADDNNGDASIKTGDIDVEKEIINDVNKSVVKVTCCEEKEKEKEKPQPVTPAEKPVSPAPSPSGHGGPGPKEEVQAAALEEVLPITGNLWFFLALAANIAMLIFGTYLRLRSGRSPGMALA